MIRVLIHAQGVIDSTPFGLGVSQIFGSALGVAAVVFGFLILHWFKRRSRMLRNERPPQNTKLLRPAGHSLSVRIQELDAQWDAAAMKALLAGAVLGLLWSAFYPVMEGVILNRVTLKQLGAHPQAYILYTGAALGLAAGAWAIASFIRAAELHSRIRNHRFGLRGEQAVAEASGDPTIVRAGYIVFHDVPGDGLWNIDHVLIGPGGIFVLETKTRARKKAVYNQQDQDVIFDGKELRFPWCKDSKASVQAERNAEWVRRFIDGFAPANMIIQPIVVIPGWFVISKGNYPVKAMNAKYLVNHITSFSRRYSEDQLRSVVRRFDERCRDLEF